MDKNSNVKNRIIEVTTELIEQHNGNIKDITARKLVDILFKGTVQIDE